MKSNRKKLGQSWRKFDRKGAARRREKTAGNSLGENRWIQSPSFLADKSGVKNALAFILLICSASGLFGAVTLTPNPATVNFTYQIGAALPAAVSVSVRASTGTPAFTTAIVGANSQWLTVSPDSGTLPGTLSVRANPTSLGIGSYSATITVTAVGITLNITANLTVSSAPGTLAV